MSDDAFMIRPVTIGIGEIVSSNAAETYPVFEHFISTSDYEALAYGAIVRSSFDNRLYQNIVGPFAIGAATITNANPAVVTSRGHGRTEGSIVTFYDEGTGAMPAALKLGQPYVVTNPTDDTFELLFDATEDTPIDTSANSGTGTHFYYKGDANSGYWQDPYYDATYDYSAVYLENFPAMTPAPRWLDLGPDNTTAMFDGYNGTASVFPSGADVTIRPGTRADAIGFDDLEGATLRLVQNDGSTDTYDQTFPLVDNSEVIDYYSFFYGERRQIRTLIVDDLPGYVLDPRITITGPTRIGNCSPGRRFDLGFFDQEGDVGSRSYTTVNIDDTFGTYGIVQRRPAKKANGNSAIPSYRVDAVKRVLDDHDGVPAFWCLAHSYESMKIFGLCRDYSIALADVETQSVLTCQIEGMV